MVQFVGGILIGHGRGKVYAQTGIVAVPVQDTVHPVKHGHVCLVAYQFLGVAVKHLFIISDFAGLGQLYVVCVQQ